MKIVCIADTHNKHDKLIVPEGDVLVHAGDITEAGTQREVEGFIEWLAEQPHTYKIFIAGNHDYYLENTNTGNFEKTLPKNIFYLHNTSVEIEGITFWGTPQAPSFSKWAFKEPFYWDDIPNNTQILISHIPPYNILDLQERNQHLGDDALRQKVLKLNPKLHIFGHAHDSYGLTRVNETIFINASSQDSSGRYVNPPIIFDTSTES